jgi:sugar phosphate isomerase/epimerase
VALGKISAISFGKHPCFPWQKKLFSHVRHRQTQEHQALANGVLFWHNGDGCWCSLSNTAYFIHFKEQFMERRAFLRTAALSALAAVSMSPLSFGQIRGPLQRLRVRRQVWRGNVQKKIPIAVQLYSVRNAANKDLAATLAAIAKMGYDGVEFAGYYNKDPKDIRKMLDDNGLKCAGTHTGIGELRGDRFARTAEIHNILGTKYIIVPGGLDGGGSDDEKKRQVAGWVEEFKGFVEKAKPFGLFVGYHAHGGDAKVIDGVPVWERFFDATPKEVVMQMDFGNYMAGGGDPYKMIEKFAGRSKTVHLKEGGPNRPIIGEGTVDWKRAFELSETVGGAEWYVVEDEHTPDSLDRIEKCIVSLRGMGK